MTYKQVAALARSLDRLEGARPDAERSERIAALMRTRFAITDKGRAALATDDRRRARTTRPGGQRP